ncbi:MAG: bifunctional riboflavin kinase/FAD synthetase [Candidatus Omnitrophica bacterium]|nr:bifunctional riboflavin kinase/FAD synthetase [Candidatus Omnitrophota bacterium]
MKIIRGVQSLKMRGPAAVTVGIFDGVHRGHQKILRELKKYSRAINGKSCVITFEPHPLKVLEPHRTPPTLISPEHKMRLLEAEGVDLAVVINFTKDFAAMTPAYFAGEVLKKSLNTKELLVGEDFVLGKDRSGSVGHLREIGRRLKFNVRAVKPLKSGTNVISSTLIRKLIMSGDIRKAGQMLGRDVSVLGTVVRGSRRGRTIGFPTANIDPHHEAIPPSGVYIVKVKLEGRLYRGLLNIGFRPTLQSVRKGKEPVIEVYIFGFDKVIYGRNIEVMFLKKIRDEKKFKDQSKLIARIEKDMTIAGNYFRKAGL